MLELFSRGALYATFVDKDRCDRIAYAFTSGAHLSEMRSDRWWILCRLAESSQPFGGPLTVFGPHTPRQISKLLKD